MRKTHPTIERLRDATIDAVEEIIHSGIATNYKDACMYFAKKIRTAKKIVPTGFSLDVISDDEKFYANFRLWKHKNKTKQNETEPIFASYQKSSK